MDWHLLHRVVRLLLERRSILRLCDQFTQAVKITTNSEQRAMIVLGDNQPTATPPVPTAYVMLDAISGALSCIRYPLNKKPSSRLGMNSTVIIRRHNTYTRNDKAQHDGWASLSVVAG